jgi:hypothetical protein
MASSDSLLVLTSCVMPFQTRNSELTQGTCVDQWNRNNHNAISSLTHICTWEWGLCSLIKLPWKPSLASWGGKTPGRERDAHLSQGSQLSPTSITG